MFVGIDTFGCDHGRSGIGSYLMSLSKELPKAEDFSCELFGAEVDRYTYSAGSGFPFERVDVPDTLAAERYWHALKVNSFAAKRGYDAVFYAAGARILPRRFKVPGVAVVIDIVSARSGQEDAWQRRRMIRSLSRANLIIAASKFIKKDLEKCGVKNRRIEVIYNGIDHSMFYPKEIADDEVLDVKPFSIKRPYFIYASRLSGPEKKHVELIKAFSLFKERTGLPHRLVLAGSDGPYAEEVHRAAFGSKAASDIFVTGYFPHESFPELYHGSDACIFPSVNEGVGLPVLEAMATGIPVACSSKGALPEVAGNNALYFDSDNIEEVASCMQRIATEQDLRKKLVQGGLDWSARFSWQKTAERTVAALKSVAK